MKNKRRVLSCVIALAFVISTVFAHPQSVHAISDSGDLYAQRATENVAIDGVIYTIYYYYESGNRAITIINNMNDKIEKVTYNPLTTTIAYYDSIGATPVMARGWVLSGSSSQRITWDKGASAAAVAAAFAIPLATCGVAGVILAMGTTVLSVLAASAIGGTIYLTTYYMDVPLQSTHFRYVWTFTASTGDSYGPFEYYYIPPMN